MLRCQNKRAQFWLICSTNTEKIPLKLDIKRRVTAAKNNTRFRLLKKVLTVFVTQSRAKLSKHKFTWIHSNQTFCYSRDEKHTSFSLVIFKAKGVKKFSGDNSYLTFKRNSEDVSEHLDYIGLISEPLLNPTAPLNHTL